MSHDQDSNSPPPEITVSDEHHSESGFDVVQAEDALDQTMPTPRLKKRRALFLTVAIPTTIAVVGVTGYLYATKKTQRHKLALIQSGWFSLLSLVLSAFTMFLHLTTWTTPSVQTKIIRILFMAPVYSIDSWLGLYIPYVNYNWRHVPIVFNLLRDMYESYVLYQFFVYLVELSGGEEECCTALEQAEGVGPTKGTMRAPFPFCILPPITLGKPFLQHVRLCIMQYMLLKPLCTFIALVLLFTGHYEEGKLTTPDNGYPYIFVVLNVSVSVAFTSLVWFYRSIKQHLAKWNPLAKFLCIKAIIFLSFWQGLVIAVIAKSTDLFECDRCENFTEETVKTSLREYLLCIEMLLITIAHGRVFSHVPFLQTFKRGPFNAKAIVACLDQSDVLHAVKQQHRILTKKKDRSLDTSPAASPQVSDSEAPLVQYNSLRDTKFQSTLEDA